MKEKFDAATLIAEVRRRPILWQSNNKCFKNKTVTDILWEEVGKECSCPGNLPQVKNLPLLVTDLIEGIYRISVFQI